MIAYASAAVFLLRRMRGPPPRRSSPLWRGQRLLLSSPYRSCWHDPDPPTARAGGAPRVHSHDPPPTTTRVRSAQGAQGAPARPARTVHRRRIDLDCVRRHHARLRPSRRRHLPRLPAILGASLTLIEEQEDSEEGSEDARGAIAGACGLTVFAIFAALTLGHLSGGVALLLAAAGSLLTAMWPLRRILVAVDTPGPASEIGCGDRLADGP